MRRGGAKFATALVGWAKAPARPFAMARPLVRRAHATEIEVDTERTRGHGARDAWPHGETVPTPLPTLHLLSLHPDWRDLRRLEPHAVERAADEACALRFLDERRHRGE